MALSNIVGWNEDKQTSTVCGTACGASDNSDSVGSSVSVGSTEEKPAACGSACGASDKPAACGTACGASDNSDS